MSLGTIEFASLLEDMRSIIICVKFVVLAIIFFSDREMNKCEIENFCH
jgi:hypothetical protein